MLKVKQFTFNPFGENTYLIIDKETGYAVLVDPGMFNQRERDEFDNYVGGNDLKIQQIVNTHLHLDHCFGDNYVRDRYGVKIYASVSDAPLGEQVPAQGLKFGLKIQPEAVRIDEPLKDGDIIKIGDCGLHVIEVPGHSPGGIALYCPQGKFVLTGDSLFRGSIGRTDLPGGDHSLLVKSVKDKLFSLPDDTRVLPGHEGMTTIGEEKKFNPFV